MTQTTEQTMTGEGYQRLLAEVERGERRWTEHDVRAKLDWIVARAKHYAEKTRVTADAILDAWEADRTYWYMNYYQEGNQPLLDDRVRVFATAEALRESIGDQHFRCPRCGGVSRDAYMCTTPDCDWKAYGLLGTMGKGAQVYIENRMKVYQLFMPIAWEGE